MGILISWAAVADSQLEISRHELFACSRRGADGEDKERKAGLKAKKLSLKASKEDVLKG